MAVERAGHQQKKPKKLTLSHEEYEEFLATVGPGENCLCTAVAAGNSENSAGFFVWEKVAFGHSDRMRQGALGHCSHSVRQGRGK